MDYKELTQILPHREPMLLLDRAELKEGVAWAEKTIIGTEWFLQGHFPGDPVVPGVILCEILAQSACVLPEVRPATNSAPASPSRQTYLTGMENVRFRAPVRPGDCFRTQCQILRARPPFFWAKGKGFVGDTLCVTAEFSFAVR